LIIFEWNTTFKSVILAKPEHKDERFKISIVRLPLPLVPLSEASPQGQELHDKMIGIVANGSKSASFQPRSRSRGVVMVGTSPGMPSAHGRLEA
jgi:hypothetical protein